jgi:hypothetical protein
MKKLIQNFLIFSIVLILGEVSLSIAQTQRNPVLEYCTGTWCVYCPQGHAIIRNDILPNIPNAIIIGYHGPANGSDPFSYFPGNNIISLMGFSAYPTGVVGRVSGIQSRGQWLSLMNARNTVPATVSIDVSRSFNPATREFYASIDFTALTDLSGEYKFNAILLEDGMVWNQTGGSSDYVHTHVVRAMMNGALGEQVVNGIWNSGNMINKTINYTIPIPGGPGPDIIFDSCHVVVMVYKAGSPLSSNAGIQQAVEMTLIAPDYVATISSTSPDVISESGNPADFEMVIYNEGLLTDKYDIDLSFDGPTGWILDYTTENGTFPPGQTDSVEVNSGDSTVVTVSVNPNWFDGAGSATLEFASRIYPANYGSVVVRYVTTTGIDVLVVDAEEDDYTTVVTDCLDNVYPGSYGVISRSALHDAGVNLSNFQLITWSQGTTFPVFVPAEVNALQIYLDGGGNLFINGQDIGSDIFEPNGQSQFAQGFYNNYLHADYVANVGGSFYLQGYDGDPITDGIIFPIGDVYEKSADVISPFDADATPIFKFMNVPDINSIRVSTGTNKIVYFGIGLEQINDGDIRDTLMQRIINFNGVEPLQLPSVPNLIAPANSAVIDSSSALFEWEESHPQVSTYWFELDTTDQFTTAYVNTSVADISFLYSNLQYDKSYWWRVKAYNGAGWSDFSDVRTFTTVTPVSVNDDERLTPSEFSLDQNYPNPFNPSTKITYSVSQESPVTIKVFDLIGQEIAVLVDDVKEPGFYSVTFDALGLSSGVYIYQMRAGNFTSVKKMSILK